MVNTIYLYFFNTACPCSDQSLSDPVRDNCFHDLHIHGASNTCTMVPQNPSVANTLFHTDIGWTVLTTTQIDQTCEILSSFTMATNLREYPRNAQNGPEEKRKWEIWEAFYEWRGEMIEQSAAEEQKHKEGKGKGDYCSEYLHSVRFPHY